MEAAVIRATSHNDRSVDYKNARRIFSLARVSPSFTTPLMLALSRRAERTRSWPVALKCLLLAHGLLLVPSDSAPSSLGRLPFDLSDFHDKDSRAFSAFVQSYFHFLDSRHMLLSTSGGGDDDDCGMDRVEGLQALLDLLMRIRPCAEGMGAGLVLEAMDCAVIEIFEVYSGICNGVASFLVGVFGTGSEGEEERKRRGMKAIRVLRRASEQSWELTNYFEVCKSLGVLNATEFPPVDRIPDQDIEDLELLVHRGIPLDDQETAATAALGDLIQLDDEEEEEGRIESMDPKLEVVISKDWVVFEDEFIYQGNPFLCSPAVDRQWASMVHCNVTAPWNENLIDLG